MSKEVKETKQEQELNNSESPETEEVVEKKGLWASMKALGKKGVVIGKKAAPVVAGIAIGAGGALLISALGSDKADEVMDSITNALPNKREDMALIPEKTEE